MLRMLLRHVQELSFIQNARLFPWIVEESPSLMLERAVQVEYLLIAKLLCMDQVELLFTTHLDQEHLCMDRRHHYMMASIFINLNQSQM